MKTRQIFFGLITEQDPDPSQTTGEEPSVVTVEPSSPEPKPGNLYRSKGGLDTRFWLLISIKKGRTACLLGLDDEFNIVSAQSYAIHAVRHREVIGFIPIEDIRFHET